MALFPQGVTQIDKRCNGGERRVLHQLKRCLEDDYIVWHDVPLGPAARQPDFVILSPRWGVLLLEVKDWKRSTLIGATRDSVELDTVRGRVTDANPVRKARDFTLELIDLMQRDASLVHHDGPFKGKLLFPYGWGAVFSNIRQADVAGTDFTHVFAPASVLLRDDLDESVAPDALQRRLWGMFTVHYPHTLSLPQRDRIRWHLFPELRMPHAQTRLALEDETPATIDLPDLMQVMDLQQEQIARSLGEGHRVIHGAAGSGKTLILIFRAQHLAAAARPDRPILVLCYGTQLAGRLDALLRARGVDDRVQVRTFHAWCEDLLRSYQLALPKAPRGKSAYYEALAESVDRAVQTGLVPSGQYTALLIDEAHDFEDAWLRVAARMVDPATDSLLVLYDDAQSIFQKKRRAFNFSSVGIDARGRTSVLRLNYRNTAEVLALAAHCAQSLLCADLPDPTRGDDKVPLVSPASAGRRGPLPVLMRTRAAADEAELIAERIAARLAAGAQASDCAVLCRTRHLMPPIERALRRRGIALQSMASSAFRRFDWRRQSVKLITLHSAKGLEFAQVIVAGLQALPHAGESMEDELRLLYVGMTRATGELTLSTCGSSAMVERVAQSLNAITQRFAAEAAG